MIPSRNLAPVVFALFLVGFASPGCEAEEGEESAGGGAGPNAECSAPVDKPHDATKPDWSYTGADDGPDDWGTIPGYELCGTGNEQTPIDIGTSSTVVVSDELIFEDYDVAIPLVLLNNGHTLQVFHTKGSADPRINYGGKTYHLLQFHGHSTSEHMVDGKSHEFELHLVHQADDMSLAVVGILFEPGAESEIIGTLLEHNPGHHKQTTCSQNLELKSLLPVGRGFYHYNGSLTTPACNEGVSWFVLKEPMTILPAQVDEYQMEFGGTTNRPVQPVGDRVVQSSP